MSTSQRLIIPTETKSRVEARPDVMLRPAFDSQLEDTYSPVSLCLLAERERVSVYEDMGDILEGGAEVCLRGARAEV
jgi:hypothetical protein